MQQAVTVNIVPSLGSQVFSGCVQESHTYPHRDEFASLAAAVAAKGTAKDVPEELA